MTFKVLPSPARMFILYDTDYAIISTSQGRTDFENIENEPLIVYLLMNNIQHVHFFPILYSSYDYHPIQISLLMRRSLEQPNDSIQTGNMKREM